MALEEMTGCDTSWIEQQVAMAAAATFERYRQAMARLDAMIEHARTPDDKSHGAVQVRAEFRLARLRRFLDRLGNPQDRYPIVHVAGTSGKGSTSTAIAAMLVAGGYRTGLHTSPYLQTAAEKLQLDGRLIDPDVFVDLVDRLLVIHQEWEASGEEALTYGELWMSLTVFFFAEAHVDIVVLEVGAGGRFDLTNIVTPAVSVITSVGIDHTNTLGSTIEEIAWHKAGIIKPGVPAVSAVTNLAARRIVEEEAVRQGSQLIHVADWIEVIKTGAHGTTWVDPESGVSRTISLGGTFQARNGATAVASLRVLSETGFSIDASAYETGLRSVQIPGRVELIEDRVPVLLDGAHNAEKVAALAADLPLVLSTASRTASRTGARGRRIAVLGVLEAKQADEMIRSLVPMVDAIVATSPQVLAKESRDAAMLAAIARGAGFRGLVHVEPDPLLAIAYAFAQVNEHSGDAILVTGSLYLVGNVRGRWFDERDIVLQRTSWPEATRLPEDADRVRD